jgi:hypothetical protein
VFLLLEGGVDLSEVGVAVAELGFGRGGGGEGLWMVVGHVEW